VLQTHLIRHRLLTVVLLGVLTSVLSLVALVHLLTTSTAQRIERARDGVVEEMDRVAKRPADVVETIAYVGMRGGTWDGKGAPEALPAPWVEPLRGVLARATQHGGRAIEEVPVGESTLVVAAMPDPKGPPGSCVWSGFLVRPLQSLRSWQWIVVLLALATTLLVVSSVRTVVTVNRGAAELRASMVELARDLHAPIPRPAVRELGDVADGIAVLAQSLARAKSEEERLGRELSRQERLAALGRVVAGVAHEVRNPLASIKLRLDLAAAKGAQPDVVGKAIAHASSEISRLDRLVADLLVVAGRASGPKLPSSLGALARARVDGLAAWSQERGVHVTVTGDARAAIDRDSIARALDNLLRNAIEASPFGATVEVAVARRGEAAVVAVTDRGGGVPGDRTSELFEPFFTTKPEGTGLGLAISRAVARAHEGEVTYARHGEATRFELTLPASAAAETEQAA
jgi:signal transduction histidine kinase